MTTIGKITIISIIGIIRGEHARGEGCGIYKPLVAHLAERFRHAWKQFTQTLLDSGWKRRRSEPVHPPIISHVQQACLDRSCLFVHQHL